MKRVLFDQLRGHAERREMIRVRLGGRSVVQILPVFCDPETAYFWTIADREGNRTFLPDLGAGYLVATEPPYARPVAPLAMIDPSGTPITLSGSAFNPLVPEAALLCWRFKISVVLGYRKPGMPTCEARHVRIGRVEGDLLYCEDLDKSAPRSFRLDRIGTLRIHEDETHHPLWRPEIPGYSRILR